MRCARADGDGPGPLRVRTHPAYTYVSRCAPRSTQLPATDTTVTVCTRVTLTVWFSSYYYYVCYTSIRVSHSRVSHESAVRALQASGSGSLSHTHTHGRRPPPRGPVAARRARAERRPTRQSRRGAGGTVGRVSALRTAPLRVGEWKANAPLLNKENIYGTSTTGHNTLIPHTLATRTRAWGPDPWNTRALGLDRARASQAALSGSGDM